MPKEIQNPKSEIANFVDQSLAEDSVFWYWGDSANEILVLCDAAPRDLMERTAEFGEAIIRFSKMIPHTAENTRLISQLVGAATSVGANYCEADDSVSGKDFKKSIGTCRKESKETMFFLRMVAASEEALKDEARTLWREAKELNLIFGAIWRNRNLETLKTNQLRASVTLFGFRPSDFFRISAFGIRILFYVISPRRRQRSRHPQASKLRGLAIRHLPAHRQRR